MTICNSAISAKGGRREQRYLPVLLCVLLSIISLTATADVIAAQADKKNVQPILPQPQINQSQHYTPGVQADKKDIGLIKPKLPMDPTHQPVPLSVSIVPPAGRVVQGGQLVFQSSIKNDPAVTIIRQTWTGPNNRTGAGSTFTIFTDNLQPGNFQVTLAVIDSRERRASATATLEVMPKKTVYRVDLNANPLTTGEGGHVIFRALLTPPNPRAEYQFSFGDDAAYSWSQNWQPDHVYLKRGTYTARVDAREGERIIARSIPVQIEVISGTAEGKKDKPVTRIEETGTTVVRGKAADSESGSRPTAAGRPVVGNITDNKTGIPWHLPVAGILLVAGCATGYYQWKKMRNQNGKSPVQTSLPLDVRPVREDGSQEIRRGADLPSHPAIHLKPQADPGIQEIEFEKPDHENQRRNDE
jgi:hypothetical protein